jgi:hypothetical protein
MQKRDRFSSGCNQTARPFTPTLQPKASAAMHDQEDEAQGLLSFWVPSFGIHTALRHTVPNKASFKQPRAPISVRLIPSSLYLPEHLFLESFPLKTFPNGFSRF